MLSFTVAHAAVIALRIRKPDPDQPFQSPLNLKIGRIDVPVFAILGGLGTFGAFLVTCALFPTVRYAGIAWLVLGMVVYVVYRKPPGAAADVDGDRGAEDGGPAVEIEYRDVVLHVTDADVADEMTVTALKLAAEQRRPRGRALPDRGAGARGARRVTDEEERAAHTAARRGRGARPPYGVPVIGRLVRTRHAGRALVDEARAARLRGRSCSARPGARRAPPTCSAAMWTTRCATRPARSWSGRRPSGAGRAGRRRRRGGYVR